MKMSIRARASDRLVIISRKQNLLENKMSELGDTSGFDHNLYD